MEALDGRNMLSGAPVALSSGQEKARALSGVGCSATVWCGIAQPLRLRWPAPKAETSVSPKSQSVVVLLSPGSAKLVAQSAPSQRRSLRPLGPGLGGSNSSRCS